MNGRTLHRTEGAEHAAVARIRAQQRFAVTALVVKLAGIRGHSFPLGIAAARASEFGLKDDGAHDSLARRREVACIGRCLDERGGAGLARIEMHDRDFLL